MRHLYLGSKQTWFLTLLLGFGLSACGRESFRPLHNFNHFLLQSTSSRRAPALGNLWFVSLVKQQGKETIELIDLRRHRPVPLPGLNRADTRPISVSVSANGQRLALIRERDDQTELLLYERNFGSVKRLELSQKGIPRKVSLDGLGKLLAVQFSREGTAHVELIRLPS